MFNFNINTKRVYLFEKDVAPLVVQRNRAEFGELVKQSIRNVVRDSIPVEILLRAYLDESTDLIGTVKEPEVVKKEEEKTDNIIDQKKAELKSLLKENEADDKSDKNNSDIEMHTQTDKNLDSMNATEQNVTMKINTLTPDVNKPVDENATLSFSNTYNAIGTDKKEEVVTAPKDIPTLEKISTERYAQRKSEEEEDGEEKLTIHMGPDVVLSNADVQDISIPAPIVNEAPLILTDVEVLV